MDDTRLDRTVFAADWLKQFGDADQIVAHAMLESLVLVSASEFESGLRTLMESTLRAAEGPIALYAVRELAHERKQKEHYFGNLPDRSKQPVRVPAPGSVGSEGRVAHIIAKMTEGAPLKLLDHPSLAAMAEKRCRTIVVIDDLIGSGRRTRDFVQHVYRHPTIMSWHSQKKIHLIVLAFAATADGLQVVESSGCPGLEIAIHRGCSKIWEGREATEIAAMRDLCREYASKTSRPKIAFGFGKLATSMVFSHGCPNTAPAILWATKTASWDAVFPNRHVPAAALPFFEPARVRQGGREVVAPVSDLAVWKKHPGILALFLREAGRRKKQSVEPILRTSIATGISIQQCAQLRRVCIDNGLLRADWRLTAAGVLELDELKRRSRKTANLERDSMPYFPRRLRPRSSLA